jgi:N-methyl-L-tryptophan oxidase
MGDHDLSRMKYSVEEWAALEEALRVELFVKTGLLNLGKRTDEFYNTHFPVLSNASIPFEWLDSSELHNRYPNVSYPKEWGAAFEPGAGVLLADRCLNAVQKAFLALGGKILDATPVTSLVHLSPASFLTSLLPPSK